MTSVYLALIAGIRVSEIADNKDSKRFRLRLLGAALLFVGGFASIYVAAGAIAGYAGSVLENSILNTLSLPFRLVGGGILIYMGLQASGLLPRLLGVHSSPLFPRVNASCRTGGSFTLGLTFGCLQCFRGSLVVAMLFFAWSMGSALSGGIMMLILAGTSASHSSRLRLLQEGHHFLTGWHRELRRLRC